MDITALAEAQASTPQLSLLISWARAQAVSLSCCPGHNIHTAVFSTLALGEVVHPTCAGNQASQLHVGTSIDSETRRGHYDNLSLQIFRLIYALRSSCIYGEGEVWDGETVIHSFFIFFYHIPSSVSMPPTAPLTGFSFTQAILSPWVFWASQSHLWFHPTSLSYSSPLINSDLLFPPLMQSIPF